MSQFNAEKHVEDISKITDALLAILGNTGKLIYKEYKETVDLAKEAAKLRYGKPSSMLKYSDYQLVDDIPV
ncbi:MAG: hypothetical protein ACOVOW_18295, partial [Spirosomataceae bacterium]